MVQTGIVAPQPLSSASSSTTMAADAPVGGMGSASDTKTVTVSSAPPLVGSITGSSGAVINLAFANADLVQRAAGMQLPQQVTPQVATITLTRDMRNDVQLNPSVQKPIIVTVSGIPGLTAGSRAQLGTPISLAGHGPGMVSIATTQAGISADKVLACPIPGARLGPGPGGGTVVVTTMPPPTSSAAAVLVGKPGSFTVFPASQGAFGTALFAATPATTGTSQPFGTVIAATAPSETSASTGATTTPTSTVTMAVFAATPVTTTNTAGTSVAGMATCSSGSTNCYSQRLTGTLNIPSTSHVPITTNLSGSIPGTVAVSIPASTSGPIPVTISGPIPVSVSATVPKSTQSMPSTVPVAVLATVPATTPATAAENAPATAPATVPATIPLTVPLNVPRAMSTNLPMVIPVATPVTVPATTLCTTPGTAQNIFVATEVPVTSATRSLLPEATTVATTTTTVSTVSSVPTPIAATVATSAASPVPVAVSTTGSLNTVGPCTTDPTNSDFDPIQAMDWKDGIATLPGSNLKFRLTEFGTLEVVSEETEGQPTTTHATQTVHAVKIAPKVQEPESPLKAFVVPQYTTLVPGSAKEEEVSSNVEPADTPKSTAEDEKNKGCDEIICCQFCSCHGLRSEFVRDGHFCGQLCYVNYTSRERIKRKEEIIKKKKRKVTPNGEEADDSTEEGQPPRKDARLSLKFERGSDENGSEPAALRQTPLKPKCKPFSWSEYLEKEKATAAPAKLFKDFQATPAGKNGFRVGMKLEAIDPRHPAMFCVVTVVETVGYRMRLHFDGYSDSFDFWTNADSADIFPVGWCERTSHILYPPKGYSQQGFNWTLYLKASKAQAAPKHLFTSRNSQMTPVGFRVGMKLEAVDKRQPGLVCVATVADLMEGGRFLVHFDGLDGSYDYWADPGSPFVHPVHWCRDHNHSLTPPSTCKGNFSWEKYLAETKSQAVPGRAFKPRVPQGFRRGMRLEAVDPRNPRLVRVMSVASVQPTGLTLHVDGWPSTYDLFVEEDNPDIHPAGWCAKTGHPLEPPPGDVQDSQPNTVGNCPTPGCSGIGHIKGPKFASHHSAFGCPYSSLNMEKEPQLPDRLGNSRSEILIDIVHVAQDVAVVGTNSTAEGVKGSTIDGLRRCPTPGCNGSGHLNQKYSVHHKASGCPLASGRGQPSETANGDDSSQDSLQGTSPSIPRGRGRPRKNRLPVPIVSSPRQAKTEAGSRAGGNNDLHQCVHQSIFCASNQPVQGLAPPPGPEKSLCWEQHSKLLSNLDLVSGTVVTAWSVSQVATFVCSLPGCQSVAKVFRDEQIDGEAFLLLSQTDLVRGLRLKLGPALKIYSCILKFRSTYDAE